MNDLSVPRFVFARSVTGWIALAGVIRFVLMLLIHFSGVEKDLALTKDAFLYDNAGLQIAEHWRSGNDSIWPSRVEGVIDFAWEYTIGIVYYVFGHAPLVVKVLCVIAGTAVPYVYYRIAQVMTSDEGISRCVLVAAVFFPTQVYYSALMVRDSVATLAMALIFLGIATMAKGGDRKCWLYLTLGFVVILGLRSYVASVMAVIIPAAFIVTSFAALQRTGVLIRSVLAASVIGLLILLALFVSPEIVGELDTQYTDLNYINKIRTKMNHGSGAMYSSGEVTEIGTSVAGTVEGLLIGVYYFFFSIDPTSIGSVRQVMAIPEVLLVGVGAIYAVKGFFILWRHSRAELLPVLIPTLVLTLGYSAATTNGGPLMRWRMQIIGVYLVMAVVGWVMARRAKLVRTPVSGPGMLVRA